MRVDSVEIGEFDARGVAGFNEHRNVPAQTRVAGVGIEV